VRWYEGWVRRLAEKYEQPIFFIERMPLGTFYREIATLYADAIIREAERVKAKTSDRKERSRLDREWAKLQKSDDWFDKMVVERVQSNT
jgi:hypothetical protein